MGGQGANGAPATSKKSIAGRVSGAGHAGYWCDGGGETGAATGRLAGAAEGAGLGTAVAAVTGCAAAAASDEGPVAGWPRITTLASRQATWQASQFSTPSLPKSPAPGRGKSA